MATTRKRTIRKDRWCPGSRFDGSERAETSGQIVFAQTPRSGASWAAQQSRLGSMRREEHVRKAAARRCGLIDGAKQRFGSASHQPAA